MLRILGMGPGDPELVTLKAARLLGAAEVVAFFAKRGEPGHARRAAEGLLAPGAIELRLDYPFTTELPSKTADYRSAIALFYDEAAVLIAGHLAAGREVALLCEGDAFLYGSAMYVFERLHRTHACEVVAGITAMSAAWTRAGLPIARGEEVLTVLPGIGAEAELARRLASGDAVVIMKVGRNLPKIRAALEAAGRLHGAVLVERASMPGERVCLLAEIGDAPVPYFSLVLVPAGGR